LSQTLTNDLMQQFVAALRKDYGVHVNNAAIDAQFQK